MSKAGYDFVSSSNPGKKVSNTINDKEHDLTKTQKKLKKHGYRVDNNKAGLDFTPNAPTLVFDRINHLRPRISALDRINGQDQTSVFKRHNTPTSQSSVFKRMKRQAILEVDTIGSLKVRMCTIIHTGQSSRQQARKDGTAKKAQDVFHITIQEGKVDEIPEEDVTAAPPQLED
ncbi:hypothetical protein ACFX1Z_027795 [Malus domestica]